jgi:hypothetical protein
MSVPIYVDEYSGDAENQCPRSFTLNEDLEDIAAVLEQSYEPYRRPKEKPAWYGMTMPPMNGHYRAVSTAMN